MPKIINNDIDLYYQLNINKNDKIDNIDYDELSDCEKSTNYSIQDYEKMIELMYDDDYDENNNNDNDSDINNIDINKKKIIQKKNIL